MIGMSFVSSGCLLALLFGWSEPAALVEDELVQLVLRINILPARQGFFFHLLSAPKFSTYHLPPPSYLPPSYPPSNLPPTYHLPPPSYLPPSNPTPPLTPLPKLQRPRAVGARVLVVERELESLEPERDPRAHETHAPMRR